MSEEELEEKKAAVVGGDLASMRSGGSAAITVSPRSVTDRVSSGPSLAAAVSLCWLFGVPKFAGCYVEIKLE